MLCILSLTWLQAGPFRTAGLDDVGLLAIASRMTQLRQLFVEEGEHITSAGIEAALDAIDASYPGNSIILNY